MSRSFLYIVDPLPNLDVKTDTTLAIMEEASSRGISNFACLIKDIVIKDGHAHFWSAPVAIKKGYNEPPDYVEDHRLCKADEFSAIFMRKDPPVDEAFWSALLMLRHHHHKKTIMINDPEGLMVANEKLFGLSIAPELFPPTLVATDRSIILDFIKEQAKVVLKPLYGSGGAGVLVMGQEDRNLSSTLELLTRDFTRPVVVQAYIKNARSGDKRIIVLGGEAVGAMLRIPSDHDHRANLHAGGQAQPVSVTDQDQAIVQLLSPHLKRLGLHFVGIDIIGGYLTEINVTSPTGIIEIERFSPGAPSLRARIIDYVENLLA